MALSKIGLIDPTAITGETALAATPADTDEILISDAGTLKRIDFSHIKSDPTHVLLDDTYISSNTASVTYSSSLITDTYEQYIITGTGIRMHTSAKGNVLAYFSNDNGSSYNTSDGNYVRSVLIGQGGLSANALNARHGNDDAIQITGNAFDFGKDGNAGHTANFVLRCYNLRNLDTNTAVNRYVNVQSTYDDRDTAHGVSCMGDYIFMANTTEINNIQLSASNSNTFGEGEFRLYGVK